ncbi:zinc-ribbon domain-containing protein [bacterium]|nr:zinc-ribbon domain-containing protein [bacterium]
MILICPKCNAENRDAAKFCDQCGARLAAAAITSDTPTASSAPTQAPIRAGSQVNWKGILIIMGILGGIAWLLKPAAGPAGDMAGMPNPHANLPVGPEAMEQVMEQVAEAKMRLEADPLDIDALSVLYQLFGTIGRQEEVHPYLEAMLAAIVEGEDDLDGQAKEMLSEIAQVAVAAGDVDGALLALETRHRLDPADLGVITILGHISYEMERAEDAIKWYTLYLELANPEDHGEEYWNVRTDRATMYLLLAEVNEDSSYVGKAIEELLYITGERHDFWNAWFNLGIAYKTSGDTQLAGKTFEHCSRTAEDDLQAWRAESELAELRGEEPPEPPPNPHGM